MQILSTPFGRRALSLDHIAAQMRTDRAMDEAAKPGSNHPAAVNKWTLYRTLTQIRERLGISDRSLTLLNALLSFHPETALTMPRRAEEAAPEGEGDGWSQDFVHDFAHDLVVFPSNKALALRAAGMAEKTLRRHLSALVEAGLIIRRDSPNGKRYARKDVTGAERFSDVYGFDLTPLVARAPEFEMLAEDTRRAARARALLKERITLRRRDAAKLIALGLDDGLPGDWEALRQRFMALVTPLRRILADDALEQTATALTALCAEAETLVSFCVDTDIMTGNAGDFDRQQSNSNTKPHTDLEPASKEDGASVAEIVDASRLETKAYDAVESLLPLGLVLEACPDVKEYAASTIRTWPQFMAAARSIRPMLGISPDAWAAAVNAMGDQNASIAISVILQRSEYSSEAKAGQGSDGKPVVDINGSPAVLSPGGYLRALTEKALVGAFSPGPVLMALIGQRMKVKRAGG